MVDIAVLGDVSFTLGFQMAGVKKIVQQKQEKTAEQFKTLLQDKDIGIIITQEESMKYCDEQLREELENSVHPVCIVVSPEEGSSDSLRKLIKKSIGVDLMQDG